MVWETAGEKARVKNSMFKIVASLNLQQTQLLEKIWLFQQKWKLPGFCLVFSLQCLVWTDGGCCSQQSLYRLFSLVSSFFYLMFLYIGFLFYIYSVYNDFVYFELHVQPFDQPKLFLMCYRNTFWLLVSLNEVSSIQLCFIKFSSSGSLLFSFLFWFKVL